MRLHLIKAVQVIPCLCGNRFCENLHYMLEFKKPKTLEVRGFGEVHGTKVIIPLAASYADLSEQYTDCVEVADTAFGNFRGYWREVYKA